MRASVRILLVSTYELGRQPFGLASPAAWLRRDGHEVACVDLAVESPEPDAVRDADMIAFHIPMHTATRLASRVIPRFRALNPRARFCCYGLYAPLNEAYLRSLGVDAVIGGEFETALSRAASGEDTPGGVSLGRQRFLTPDRSGLPPLSQYAHVHVNGARKPAGYTEASRGCKHLCRHCPVAPVYGGRFRIIERNVVLEDVRRQVAAGAQHITFGDPDFLNGPAHSLRIVRALHEEHPSLTYDVTAKIEHLKQHRGALGVLKQTGCLFVTTAVESVEDDVLRRLKKGHTREDFVQAARDCREAGLALAPTFVPFTPWTTLAGYRELLRALVDLDLVDHVPPVQLGLRLLITAGSRLLELPDVRALVQPFEEASLVYPWKHRDPALDELSAEILAFAAAHKGSRREAFARIWELACDKPLPRNFKLIPRAAVPYLDEPWYC
jgi:radical SAM superfamily enzyme YgiQ (UPF0313 family)